MFHHRFIRIVVAASLLAITLTGIMSAPQVEAQGQASTMASSAPLGAHSGKVIIPEQGLRASQRLAPTQVNAARQRAGAQDVSGLHPLAQAKGFRVYNVPNPNGPTKPVEQLVRELRGLGIMAEYDYLVKATEFTPNDPMVSSMHHLRITRVMDAWETYLHAQRTQITIGVVDSGVNPHPDLPPIVAEENFREDADTSRDLSGHGTHVAGTVLAQVNNAIGVSGVAGFPSFRLVNARALGANGVGTLLTVAEGSQWAVKTQGARVITLSLGATGVPCGAFQTEVYRELSQDYKALIVASAGNDGNSSNNSPANCAGVVAVSATESDGRIASFSNHEPTNLLAPGVLITSTKKDGGYETRSGTSMSVPTVAGIGAMRMSLNPSATPGQIVQVMRSTSEKPSTNAASQKVVRADLALTASLPPLPPPPPTPCNPRPPIRVAVTSVTPTELTASIQASSNEATTGNYIRTVQIGTPVQNGTVRIQGGQVAPGQSVTVAANTTLVVLSVQRTAGRTHVPLIVTDACGPWNSFVGVGS